ncbi:MAG: winged helix-turn-helix domain-containing protein [Candidatus Micrarchaeota archaeon]
MLKLSVLELRALSVLSESPKAVGQLAASLGASKSLASRVARSLQDKGLASASKEGVKKMVCISEAAHAQAFKRLLQSRPNARIEEWLSGFALDVLVVAGPFIEGADKERLYEECACSRATVNKTVRKLRSAGVAMELYEAQRFAVTDGLVSGFAAACADWLQLRAQKGLQGYNVSVRVGKHVVLRTDARQVPAGFTVTGMTALIRSGLPLTPTSHTDYYYQLDGSAHQLRIEEQFAHALLLATLPQHAGDRTSLAIFLATRHDLNNRLLAEAAKRFLVSGLYEELRRVNELKEKTYGLTPQGKRKAGGSMVVE